MRLQPTSLFLLSAIALIQPAVSETLDNRTKSKKKITVVDFNVCPPARPDPQEDQRVCITSSFVGPSTLYSGEAFSLQINLNILTDKPSVLTLDWQGVAVCSGTSLQQAQTEWRNALFIYMHLNDDPDNGYRDIRVAQVGFDRVTQSREVNTLTVPVRISRRFFIFRSGLHSFWLSGFVGYPSVNNGSCIIYGGDGIAYLTRSN